MRQRFGIAISAGLSMERKKIKMTVIDYLILYTNIILLSPIWFLKLFFENIGHGRSIREAIIRAKGGYR